MNNNVSEIWESIINELHIEKIYNNGFNMIRCNCCHDYQARGGWKIEDNKIIYNCFNCSTAAVLDTNFKSIPQRFMNVLESFFDNTFINHIKTLLFVNDNDSTSKYESKYKDKKSIDLPNNVTPINDETKNYLKNKRGIDYNKIECYNVIINEALYVLFAIRDRGGKLTNWEARLLKGQGERYLSAGNKNENPFNIQALYNINLHRIYITDGIFDSLSIYPYAISLLGSKINNEFINKLKNIGKEIVLIVDNDKQGGKLGKLFLKNGFKIAKINSDYKDLNALYSASNFNRIEILQKLNESILDSIESNYHIKKLLET